jgi:signal transduction histidine kinase
MPVGTVVFAADDATICAINAAFRAFLSPEFRDRPRRGVRLSERVPLHDEPVLQTLVCEVVASGRAARRTGMSFPFLSGPDRVWDVELSPLAIEGDRAHLLVLTVVPAVAASQAAPATATAREAELLDKVEEMQLLNDVLIASVQQKQLFVTAMSHRLRTPLTTIVGYGEMLVAGEVADAADRQMVFGDILAAGQLTLGLIDDMIELARLDAGNLRLHREYVDVAEILEDARISLEALASARRQRLIFDIPSSGLTAFADARWMTEVILKLGMNALRFSPTGGTATFRARDYDGTHVALDVSDAGVGIKPEDQARVFDAFGARAGIGAQEHGTGLELALTKRLVELQGGTIGFESARGIGTTFTVTLPKREETVAEAES